MNVNSQGATRATLVHGFLAFTLQEFCRHMNDEEAIAVNKSTIPNLSA